MSTIQAVRATLNDLYREEGKAELIGGRIVRFMASGKLPSRVAFGIAKSLDVHATRTGSGTAYPGGIGYAVPELPSGRESFSPDASYYAGPDTGDPMRFIEGPPTFAVEVRSENDYGEAAEAEMAAKRVDYFAARTLVVWDVDPQAETVVVYRAASPGQPVTYRRGQTAEAEPAVRVGAWLSTTCSRSDRCSVNETNGAGRHVGVAPLLFLSPRAAQLRAAARAEAAVGCRASRPSIRAGRRRWPPASG
jgi:Uma2 family endonuclease